MESSKNSQGRTPLLTKASSTSKPHEQEAGNPPEVVTNQQKEGQQELNGDEGYFTQEPYVQQYYTQHVPLYQALDRRLAAVQYELFYMGKNVQKLVKGMKDCSDIMEFYVTRTLSLQKEMLHAIGETNNSLQSIVHLHHKMTQDQEQRPHGSSSATRYTEQDKVAEESDKATTWYKDREPRHRSRSEDRSSQYRKRYKER